MKDKIRSWCIEEHAQPKEQHLMAYHQRTRGTNAIKQTRGLGIFTGGYNFNMKAQMGTVIRRFTYKI